MPEPISSTALAPVDGEYQIKIRELDAAGGASTFMVPVPANITSAEASVMLRSAILKRTTWKAFEMPFIIHAVIYADRMGLDIMAGDVYSAEGGRLSTTSGAKIRHAMSTGRIEGYEVNIEEGAEVKIPYKVAGKDGMWIGKELKATATVFVKGWKSPVVYTSYLTEWFLGSNPNWRSRPAYMLRRNVLSKVLEEVAPMGIDSEEAPPLESAGA